MATSFVLQELQEAREEFLELELYHRTIESYISEYQVRGCSVAGRRRQGRPTGLDCGSFSSRLRASFLVSLMSALDHHLGNICYALYHMQHSQLAPHDLRGSTVERGHKYLKAVQGFTRPENEEWEQLAAYFALRNLIVHNGSDVDESRHEQRLRSFLERTEGISCDSEGVLEIEAVFCRRVLTELLSFMQELQEETGRVIHK